MHHHIFINETFKFAQTIHRKTKFIFYYDLGIYYNTQKRLRKCYYNIIF